jgi:hypothetical protein
LRLKYLSPLGSENRDSSLSATIAESSAIKPHLLSPHRANLAPINYMQIYLFVYQEMPYFPLDITLWRKDIFDPWQRGEKSAYEICK